MNRRRISSGKVILIGHLIVNVPVTAIIVFTAVRCVMAGLSFFAGMLIRVVGWLYWSFVMPRWRRWALRNGADEDNLYKWSRLTLLTWRKGSAFEKTEMKLKDKRDN